MNSHENYETDMHHIVNIEIKHTVSMATDSNISFSNFLHILMSLKDYLIDLHELFWGLEYNYLLHSKLHCCKYVALEVTIIGRT